MVYFVTQAYLTNVMPINANVDVNDYLFNVKTSADMYARSVLGTYFYNDLLTKYNAQTMSNDELTLLEYIQATIAWRSISESMITVSYQLKNKGVQTQSGDFSANAEMKEIMFMVHHYADRAAFYQDRLFKYLVDNKALFSNFTSDLNTDSTAKHSCNGDSNNFNQNILFI